jgi:hypothetical protein
MIIDMESRATVDIWALVHLCVGNKYEKIENSRFSSLCKKVSRVLVLSYIKHEFHFEGYKIYIKYIVTYLLKARTVKPADVAVARKRLYNHASF